MVARKGNKRGELNEDSRKMVLLMLKYVCMRLEKVTMGKKTRMIRIGILE